jgi:hypothetical protein
MTLQNPVKVDSNWQQMFYNLTYNAGTVQTVGFTLPKYGVLDLRSFGVFVTVAESGGTIDVGFKNAVESGDEDGIIDGISLTSTGWVFPTITLTQGTNAHYISATTYGLDVIPAAQKGANTAEQNAVITWDPWAFVGNGTIKTMTYTVTSATTTFKGVLTFRWRQLPDPSQSAMQWPLI